MSVRTERDTMGEIGTVNLGLVEAKSGVVGGLLAGLQQAHVTCRHTAKDRSRSVRWLAELTRCRPTRNRFWMTP